MCIPSNTADKEFHPINCADRICRIFIVAICHCALSNKKSGRTFQTYIKIPLLHGSMWLDCTVHQIKSTNNVRNFIQNVTNIFRNSIWQRWIFVIINYHDCSPCINELVICFIIHTISTTMIFYRQCIYHNCCNWHCHYNDLII